MEDQGRDTDPWRTWWLGYEAKKAAQEALNKRDRYVPVKGVYDTVRDKYDDKLLHLTPGQKQELHDHGILEYWRANQSE